MTDDPVPTPTPKIRRILWACTFAALLFLTSGCGDPIKGFQSDNPVVRKRATNALLREATPEQETQFCDLLLTSDQPALRSRCAGMLMYLKSRAAVPSLIKALGDEHWIVRRSVIHALTQIGDDRAAGPLVAVLSDKEVEARLYGAKAFQKFKSPDAVPALVLLIEKDPKAGSWITDTSREAIRALGFQGDRRALPHLAALLDSWAARHAAKAMGEIVGEDFLEEVSRFKGGPYPIRGDPAKAKAWLKKNPLKAK